MGAALVLLLVALGAMAAGVLIGRYYVPDDRQLRRTARHGRAYMRALTHLIARDHDTVMTELLGVVEENVEDVEPYFALGALFRSRGEHERAIRVHQALAMRERERRKLRHRAMYELGLDFRAAGMPRRATRAMENVLVEEPAHEGALRALAALYEEQARFNEAAGLWQRLGRRRGEDLSDREHHLLVAAAQAALGRDDLDSAKQLLKAAQKYQESAHFFAAAAELAAARGNHRGARERLRQALTAEPGLAPHLLPGLIAAEQGLAAGDDADAGAGEDDDLVEEAERASDALPALSATVLGGRNGASDSSAAGSRASHGALEAAPALALSAAADGNDRRDTLAAASMAEATSGSGLGPAGVSAGHDTRDAASVVGAARSGSGSASADGGAGHDTRDGAAALEDGRAGSATASPGARRETLEAAAVLEPPAGTAAARGAPAGVSETLEAAPALEAVEARGASSAAAAWSAPAASRSTAGTDGAAQAGASRGGDSPGGTLVPPLVVQTGGAAVPLERWPAVVQAGGAAVPPPAHDPRPLEGMPLVPAPRPRDSVAERVIALLAAIEAQSGPRLELALIRAQLLPRSDAEGMAALATELVARFPEALAARVAAARLALVRAELPAIRRALDGLVSDGGALAWTLRGRWQCARCGHRPGPFSWRCAQCRRWGTLRMETGIEPPPPPPRDRRAAPRPVRVEGLLGVPPDQSLPAATLEAGLSDVELASAGMRRSLLGRVGGWFSAVWRRDAR